MSRPLAAAEESLNSIRGTSSPSISSTTGTPRAMTGCILIPPSMRALVWSLTQASVYAPASETLFIIPCWIDLMRCLISGRSSHLLACGAPPFPFKSSPLAKR